jgi:hypothetical protein
VEADVTEPVESWPYEALVSTIERGSVRDWARITRALTRDPWGPLARNVEAYLGYAEESGAVALLRRALARARTEAEAADREAVADRVRELIAASGYTAGQFASRAGTSPSRLSTYATGRVVPSAALMLRFERVARTGPGTLETAADQHERRSAPNNRGDAG